MRLGDDTIEDKGPAQIGFCFAEGHLGRHVSRTYGFSWSVPFSRVTIPSARCRCATPWRITRRRADSPTWDDMTR